MPANVATYRTPRFNPSASHLNHRPSIRPLDKGPIEAMRGCLQPRRVEVASGRNSDLPPWSHGRTPIGIPFLLSAIASTLFTWTSLGPTSNCHLPHNSSQYLDHRRQWR